MFERYQAAKKESRKEGAPGEGEQRRKTPIGENGDHREKAPEEGLQENKKFSLPFPIRFQ